MTLRFDLVDIVVRDMKAMTEFYRRLGLDISETPPEWESHHRDIDTDVADLHLDSPEFAAVWNQGWPGGSGIVLGFKAPDRQTVDRLYNELTNAGYRGQQQPYDTFWGARYSVVTDPDGNSVGIMSPSDASRQSVPPPPPS
jgi:uncharacterized glyoxalase superfamily protein PhnB